MAHSAARTTVFGFLTGTPIVICLAMPLIQCSLPRRWSARRCKAVVLIRLYNLKVAPRGGRSETQLLGQPLRYPSARCRWHILLVLLSSSNKTRAPGLCGTASDMGKRQVQGLDPDKFDNSGLVPALLFVVGTGTLLALAPNCYRDIVLYSGQPCRLTI